MAMRRILGGAGGNEEVLRLRFKNEGEQELRKAQQALKRVEAEQKELNEAFERGAVHADRYKERMKELTQEQNRYASAVERRAKAERSLPKAGGPFYAGRAVASAAQGGSAMGIANNLFFAARSAGGVGALAKDLAKLPIALAGVAASAPLATTAIIATGGALLAVNEGLKAAELSWSDFGRVMANTGPIRGATEAATGLVQVLGETSVGQAGATVWDGFKTIVHETANITLGWDDATEAAKRFNEEQRQAARLAEEVARGVQAAGKVLSSDQHAAQEGGARFASMLAELGGAGGVGGTLGGLAVGHDDASRQKDLDGLFADFGLAQGGDTKAAERILARLGARGHDVDAMRGFAFGPEADMDPSRMVGPTRETMAEQQALLAQDQKDRDDFITAQIEGDKAWREFDAKQEAEQQAASDRLASDQAADELDRLALARLQLDGMGGGLAAPGVFDAGSFAQQVQAGGGADPLDLLKEAVDQRTSMLKQLELQTRILERSGRLGA
jgi:hypothetical protein